MTLIAENKRLLEQVRSAPLSWPSVPTKRKNKLVHHGWPCALEMQGCFERESRIEMKGYIGRQGR
eukprot:601144-Pelagomonas_calceolata.AAC.3